MILHPRRLKILMNFMQDIGGRGNVSNLGESTFADNLDIAQYFLDNVNLAKKYLEGILGVKGNDSTENDSTEND